VSTFRLARVAFPFLVESQVVIVRKPTSGRRDSILGKTLALQGLLTPMSAGLSFAEAAAVSMAAISVLQGLWDYGQIPCSQQVLIMAHLVCRYFVTLFQIPSSGELSISRRGSLVDMGFVLSVCALAIREVRPRSCAIAPLIVGADFTTLDQMARVLEKNYDVVAALKERAGSYRRVPATETFHLMMWHGAASENAIFTHLSCARDDATLSSREA
jgi:hypothetical protein